MDENKKEIIFDAQDDAVHIKMIEQSLTGVMFHNYNIDLFDMLNLCGFKKLHTYQYKEEGENLSCLKHEYIKKFNKIPMLNTAVGFWKQSYENIYEEQIPSIVKEALNAYYDWESKVLENLLAWRKETKDKELFSGKANDVMCEIERIETIMNILDEHEYNYKCICEMSDYLYYQ